MSSQSNNAPLNRHNDSSVSSRVFDKSQVPLDTALFELRTLSDFGKDAAADQAFLSSLVAFLSDEAAVKSRIEMLKALSGTDNGLRPGIPPAQRYVREIYWVANNLGQAFEMGIVTGSHLLKLFGNPVLLETTFKVFHGDELLFKGLVDQNSLDTWHWLRNEVVSEGMLALMGQEAAGKYVAALFPDAGPEERAMAARPMEARRALAEKWLVPLDFVNETYVDP